MIRTQFILFCYSFFIFLIPSTAQSQYNDIAIESKIIHCHTSPDLLGGGVGIIDINNDGLEDIYFTGGTTHDRLFLNLGNLRFKDISFESEIYYFSRVNNVTSVTVGDLNNDGFDDLFLTTQGSHSILAVNNQDNTFTDVSASSGLVPYYAWGMASNLLDVNGDGLLDIYVSNYIKEPKALFDSLKNIVGFAHIGWQNHLFINQGDLKFTEEANAYGVNSAGCSLSSLSVDINNDGYLDILVVNDFGEWVIPNQAYIFDPEKQKYYEKAEELHLSDKIYGMGVALGDIDNNGLVDFYMTNIGGNVLRTNNGTQYENSTNAYRLVPSPSVITNPISWGCTFIDIDNDSYEDLYVTNGEIKTAPFLNTIKDNPNYLFKNDFGQNFRDISELSGLNYTIASRGVAKADLNNDGLQDLVINNIEPIRYRASSNVRVLINSANEANWIGLILKNRYGTNAIGAKVTIHYNNERRIKWIKSGGSHASSESERLIFGLGQIGKIDSLVILWPDQTTTQHYSNSLSTNNYYAIIQGNEPNMLACDNATNWGCSMENELIALAGNTQQEIQTKYYLEGGNLIIKSNLEINQIIIYDLTGRILKKVTTNNDVNKTTTTVITTHTQNSIIIVQIIDMDGLVHREKIKLY